MLQKNLIVLLLLAINLIVSILYLFIINNDKLKNGFYRLPVVIQKLYVVLFVGPLFISPFIQQTKFNFEFLAIYIVGIMFSFIGLTFILLSFVKIGMIPSIRSKSGLSTTGIYKIIRHPIYSGTIILFLGLILTRMPVIPTLYLPISVSLYFCMTLFEEIDLIKIYGDEYLDYKKKVKKRIIPYIL